MSDISSAPLVDVAGLHLSLTSPAGPVAILRGISFQVNPGETVAITGPSGSGKSTLLLALAGLEKPDSGRLVIGGLSLPDASETALAAFRLQRLGIVFQSFHLIPGMTALENVAVPLDLAGAADALASAASLLQDVGLGHRLDHYPAQMSGGEQQRVALARAFAARPSLLLADEPTGNLDQSTGAAVMDLLFRLHDRSQTTLILITHDPVLAGRCSRVLRVEDGRLVSDSAQTEPAAAGSAATRSPGVRS